MSAPLPLPVALAEPAPSPEPTSARRRRWLSWRWPLAVAAAVLATAVAGLALLRPTTGGYLDPENVGPQGARALARVLSAHGVEVRVRTRFDDVAADLRGTSRRSTVVVTRPDLLLGGRTQDLKAALDGAGADLVLVGAGPALLADLSLPVVSDVSDDDPRIVEPGCSDPLATRAGSALAGEVGYRPALGARAAAVSCYAGDAGAGYVALSTPSGRRTTLIGLGASLSNERLSDAGNAALAIGALGAHPRLVWWTPNPADTGAVDPPSLLELLPPGVLWGAVQLVVALIVAILWRARRFGRLVPEPLPVAVRSVETTLGRARLYRRARARGRAAQVLRAATVSRIAVRSNLPRTADPHDVAAAAAARTRRPVTEVTELLVGVDPVDDPALVTLARDLDALDTEVRSS